MSDLVAKKCPICGVVYGLDRAFYEYRDNGGEANGRPANWHCPNGHTLVIRESAADRLRRENERLMQRQAQLRDEIKEEQHRAAGFKGQITKMKKRSAAGVCPCCNRSFQNLRRHMTTKHPDYADDKVVPLKTA